MAKKIKSKFQIELEYIPFLLLYKFMRAISLRTAYRICGFLVGTLYYLDAKHRNRTIQHLMHAGIAKDRKTAVRMAKQCFHEFSMLLAEIFKADQCYSKDKIIANGPPASLAEFDPATRKYKNHIIATAHYGNWEIAGRAYSERLGIPMSSIMRPFDNPKIGDLILSNRACGTHELINKEHGMKAVIKALLGGRLFSILIDQHASRMEGIETVFFGHPCRTHKTPALLHLKTGIPIMPEVTRRLPGKDFRFEIEVGNMIIYQPTGDKEHDIKMITQLCTTELEKLIRNHPEQWMWAARRWLDADGRTR